MIPVVFFVLREQTRPSEQEAMHFLLQCVAQCGIDPESLLGQMGQVRMAVSNLMRPTSDFEKDFETFLQQEGSKPYVDLPHRYRWVRFSGQTGHSAEQTLMAIVFSLEQGERPVPPIPLVEFLDRGARWQELGQWGDALLCYLAGSQLHPDDLELKGRLGAAWLHHPRAFPKAHPLLREAAEGLPVAAELAVALSECFLRAADTVGLEIRGMTREQLRAWALVQAERAVALRPNDPACLASAEAIRTRLCVPAETNFFVTE